MGKSNNGWIEWKDLKGNSINIYRDKEIYISKATVS